MSLLTSEPRGRIESMDELFAIAHAMEHEAATRYADIALRMRGEENEGLAEIFERLAAEERGHMGSVTQWSEKERGRAPDPRLVRWQLPETFDDEGAGTTDPRLLSTYRTLSMAVRNEERAFAFWSYVVAHAERADVRRAAEAMANEELEHVATLRRERRRAFHAERSLSSATSGSFDDAEAELRLANLLGAVVDKSNSDDVTNVSHFVSEAREIAAELRREPFEIPQRFGHGAPLPNDAVALSELLVDRYLEAAERLRDEHAVARAQTLASRAINRLAWLRSDLPELT